MAFWKKTKEEKNISDARPSDAADLLTAAPEETKRQEKETAVSSVQPRRILGVLAGSHMTEKTTEGAQRGVYVFRVLPRANKIRVRAAVEREYGVAVSAVRMINAKEKARVRGRIVGWKPGFKKAMVTLKKGQKIEIQ